jgi:hypothetical protein
MLARSEIARELHSDETLLWDGQPVPGVRLRPADIFFIPFSIAWCGFAVFWEASAIRMGRQMGGISLFFILWGIPFVLVGLYMMVGRFYADALLRRRTYYGVTSDRIIIVTGLFARQTQSLDLETLTDLSMTEASNGGGTITFGKPHLFSAFYPGAAWPGWDKMSTPSFELENDAREVYNLIRQAQRNASRASDDLGSHELNAEPISASALGEPGTAAIRSKSHWSWLPFAVRQSQLVTRLSPQQCYERLQAKLGSDSSLVVTLSGGQVWETFPPLGSASTARAERSGTSRLW